MFRFTRNDDVRRNQPPVRGVRTTGQILGLEPLEGRQFLSASPHSFHPAGPGPRGDFGGPATYHHNTQSLTSVTFDQAPAAVQTGLQTLATTAGLSNPTSDQFVTLNNVDGVETYTLTLSGGTGASTTLTVDASGNAVTSPTTSTTTWSTLSGTDTGSNTAVATEITSIATALGLTAPTDDTTVNVTTDSAGKTTYSVLLDRDTTSTSADFGPRGGAVRVTVDADGNPAGNQSLPFSVLPSTIQDALNASAPSGATALTSDSTQSVRVQTAGGVTLYSTTFTSTGTSTTATVNADGTLTSPPSRSTTTYADVPSAAQTELQTLATANGVSDTIGSDQSVRVLTEANGTTLYTVTLPAASSTDDGTDTTHNVTLTVDAAGNPTTLPNSSLASANNPSEHNHRPGQFGFRPGASFPWSTTPINASEYFLG